MKVILLKWWYTHLVLSAFILYDVGASPWQQGAACGSVYDCMSIWPTCDIAVTQEVNTRGYKLLHVSVCLCDEVTVSQSPDVSSGNTSGPHVPGASARLVTTANCNVYLFLGPGRICLITTCPRRRCFLSTSYNTFRKSTQCPAASSQMPV